MYLIYSIFNFEKILPISRNCRGAYFKNIVFLPLITTRALFREERLYNYFWLEGDAKKREYGNLFSANRAFPLHVILVISENFNWNVHALLVVPFTTAFAICHKTSVVWLDIIMKVGFSADTVHIKKQSNRSAAIKSFSGLWKWRKFL